MVVESRLAQGNLGGTLVQVERPALGACVSVRFAFVDGARDRVVLEEAGEGEGGRASSTVLVCGVIEVERGTPTADDGDFWGGHGWCCVIRNIKIVLSEAF